MARARMARRGFFFFYVTALGLVAHSLIIQLPMVLPLLLGMVAPMLLYMRLGLLWSLPALVIVMLPIWDGHIWIIAIAQFICTVVGLWLGVWSRSIVSIAFLLGTMALLSTVNPDMPWAMQWFCAFIQTSVLVFNQYAANMMLAITQTIEQRREQTLQSQLSGRIAVYSAIPAGLLVLLTLYGATVLDMSRLNLRAHQQATDVAHALQARLESYQAELELAANQRPLLQDTDLLRNLVKHHREFISALITDKHGNVTAFYKEFIDHDIAGDNVSFRPYFQVPKQTGLPVITDMFRGQQLGKDLIVAIAVPLLDEQGFAGVLEVSIAIERLTASFGEINAGPWQNFILLDGQGYKLWGTDASTALGQPANLQQLQLQPDERLFSQSWLLSGAVPVLSNRGEHLLQQVQIAGTDWQLILYTEMEPTYWQYNTMTAITLILLGLSTLIVRHSAGQFVVGYTNTLSALVKLLRNLDVADAGPALPKLTTTSREFEQLQQSYLHLQRRIQQAVRELQQVLKEKTELSDELELRVQQRTRELATERDKANELAAVKTRFLANMSHELRTPLTVIQGYAEQLAATQQGDEPSRQLRALRDHSDFLLQIVNDILDSAKIEEGKLAINPEVFQLQQLLNELQQACQPLAERKGLRFELDLKKNLPEWIYSDSLRLRQILLNLLSNALKFTQQGFVRLTIRHEKQQLIIEVTDSGPGISAEQQVRIFQAFEQADVSTTRQFGGTGLGLFISRRLAELLGASLSLHSTLGFGSCFTLHLPLIELTADAIEHAKERVDQQQTELHEQWQGTLLLADDVDELRRLFKSMLAETGLTFFEASDGNQVLQTLQQQPVDLLLLDMHMPLLDGMGVLKQLAHSPVKPVVIAVTADVQTDVHQQILAAGAQQVLTKPLTRHALLQAVRPYVRQINESSAVATPNGLQTVTQSTVDPTNVFDELQLSYIESLPQQRVSLQQASTSELKALLHKIKGTAACLDFAALSQFAQAAETQLKQDPNSRPELAAIIDEMTKLLRQANIE